MTETLYVSRTDIEALGGETFETITALVEDLVAAGWPPGSIYDRLRGLSHEEVPEKLKIVTVDDETIQCSCCPRIIWSSDSWAPGDEPLCSECNYEVTGRWKGPSINPAKAPPPTEQEVEKRHG